MTPTLDVRHEAYLVWLCTVPQLRVPATKLAFSKELGVDESTLTRWQSRDVFKQEWRRRIDDLQGSPEKTQQLLESLYSRALEGDNNSAKLYLQATGRLAPVQLSVEHRGVVSELSDAALAELIASSAIIEHQNRLSAGVV